VEVPKQKKIHDETHFTTKFDGFMNFTLGWMLMCYFVDF
jgi:hypothetical protein